MTFEATFYLDAPIAPDVLLSFADSFEGRLNGMTITDTDLRSTRLAKPNPKAITAAFSGAKAPNQILLIEKGKDGNNNYPAFYLNFTRLPSARPDENCYALILGAPAELEGVLAKTWFNLAATAGLKAGIGYQQIYPNDSFAYATFNPAAPLSPDDLWQRIYAAFIRYTDDPASFHPVTKGKILRSVLSYNFMPLSLAEQIKQVLSAAGLPAEGWTNLGKSELWHIPSAQKQRAAYEALAAQNLVWETVWIDVATYQPPE